MSNMVNELLGKFPKKSPHLKEKGYEIIKIFGRFGQILAFLF
jgi:hypothetical protein